MRTFSLCVVIVGSGEERPCSGTYYIVADLAGARQVWACGSSDCYVLTSMCWEVNVLAV